jgi:MOSC domain-containing protein YiiM
MEVVSVNVATLRPLVVSGREVQTGIFKEPVEGPVAVGELGLDGDVQADRRVHGGQDQAVYAYAIEDVEWWESELDRGLGPGFFGENLTLRGVDVNGLSPGDRLTAGGVTLEATFPRQPCQKLATKVGDMKFVKRFAKAGRPGMYLRVVGPGELAAGDPVRLLSPR